MFGGSLLGRIQGDREPVSFVSYVFPMAASFSNTVNTRLRKEMGMAEKEGGLPLFDTDILNTVNFGI